MLSFVKLFGIAIARDLRNTLRIWRLNPGTTFASYLALTIGIGATTTIFSVLSSLLLSPLPVPDSDHVVRVTGLDNGGQAMQLSMPDALDIKRLARTVDGFAFYRERVGNFAGQTRPVMVHVLETDADLFKVMSVTMAQGRAFAADANEPGYACSLVISWAFWQTQFGGLPITGQTTRLNEEACTVTGVLPKGLDLPVNAEIWTAAPFKLNAPANGRRLRAWYGLAHLKRSASVTAFNAELASLCQDLSREHPAEDTGTRMQAVLLRDFLSSRVRSSLLILFAAVAGVLLLACTNVANLLLARSSARLREVSVRMAVGANRLKVFQQLITESVALSLAASISGLILTMSAVRFIRELSNVPIPRPESISVDWRVMLFAILAALATGLTFGSLPALRVSMTSLMEVLRQTGGRVSETRRQQIVRKLLVGAETCIATVLLIASLLLLRSFSEVSKLDTGFQSDHLLAAYVSLPTTRYGQDTMDSVRFANRVIESLKGTVGVQAETVATSVPLQNTDGRVRVQIEGSALPSHEGDSPLVLNTGVSPSFRQTLTIPLVAGRDLEEQDNRDRSATVLVNAAFARRFFPHQRAVGRRVRYGALENPNSPWLEIVGVVGDARQNGLEAAVQPEFFMPLAITVNPFLAVIIRTVDNPILHLKDIEASVRHADPDVPVFLPRTMEQVESRSLGLRTFNTWLLSGFAIVALLLASGGIFAVIAYSISQRTSEIALRMACGATNGGIVWMIVRQGLLPAFIGIALGIVVALTVNHYLESLLFGVKATDITAYALTVVLLAAFSTLAALLPARRAVRVQPWHALRYE